MGCCTVLGGSSLLSPRAQSFHVAVELGTAGFLHEVIYNKLVSVYNGATNELLKKSFKRDDDIYITSGVQENIPATFNKLFLHWHSARLCISSTSTTLN